MSIKLFRAAAIFSLLLVLATATEGINLCTANPAFPPYPVIYIRSDIEYPSGGPIQKEGNIFTFIADITNTTIEIESNNIILNGAGHTLQGRVSTFGPAAILIKKGSSNITIENLNIKLFHTGIRTHDSSNITVTKNIISGTQAIDFGTTSSNNRVIENTLSCSNPGYGCGIRVSGSNNYISRNNVIGFAINIDVFGDNTNIAHMNYWSDYNGTDTNGDGIGDIPYPVVSDVPHAMWDSNYDEAPLMNPLSIELPTPSPTQTQNPIPTTNPPTPTKTPKQTQTITAIPAPSNPLTSTTPYQSPTAPTNSGIPQSPVETATNPSLSQSPSATTPIPEYPTTITALLIVFIVIFGIAVWGRKSAVLSG